MSLVVKRTAAAGGADATQTTAAGVYSVVESMLTTAGWTEVFNYLSAPGGWAPSTVLPLFNSLFFKGQIISHNSNIYQCIQSGVASTNPTGPSGEGQSIADGTVLWRFITSAAGSAKVFQSTGESGNEKLTIRLDCNTNATPSINFSAYQYWDGTFGYNRLSHGFSTSNVHHYQYTAGNTVNYVMVGDKDGFQVFTNDSANNRRHFGGGRLNRCPGTIGTFFISNAIVTAGTNKTFNFASGDPIAAGYKLGDRVFVLAQESNTADPFNGQIPIYSAVITGLTSSSITIDSAKETTASGALIGADPQPQFNWNINPNNDVNVGTSIFFAYKYNHTVTNLWAAQAADSQGYPNGTTAQGLNQTATAEIDPNNRTNRVVLGEALIIDNLNNEIVGIVPKLYTNPRTSDALWAIGRTTKLATNYDFVTFPANTASPASQRRAAIGPITVSGSSNYTAELYYMDGDTWVEGEFVPNLTQVQQLDRQFKYPEMPPPTQPANSLWVGTLTGENPLDVEVEGILQEPPPSDKTLAGQGSPLRTGGELYPFDTSTTSIGGTGGGFNSGLN